MVQNISKKIQCFQWLQFRSVCFLLAVGRSFDSTVLDLLIYIVFFDLSRAALEREKKTQVSNLEQAKVMEKHMLSLNHEIEKLRVELANAERRSRAAATAANLGLHIVSVSSFSSVISIICTKFSVFQF